MCMCLCVLGVFFVPQMIFLPDQNVSAFGLGTSRQTVPGSTLETSNIACCWSIQFREWFMLVTLVLGITVGQNRRATLAKV